MAITIKQLAQIVGVSTTAVSLVLNNRPNSISKDVAQQIREVARQYHYTPNVLAKSLRTKKSGLIGLLIPNVTDHFYGEYVNMLHKHLKERGYSLLIACSDNSVIEEERACERLLAQGIDGLIVLPIGIEDSHRLVNRLTYETMPIITVDGYCMDLDCPLIATDYLYAGKMVIEFLRQNNHTKVACMAGASDNYADREKLTGFYKATTQFQSDFDFSRVYLDCCTLESGYAAAAKIVSSDVTAVICFHDVAAYGLIRYCNENGLILGEDIAVIGFGDFKAAAFLSVPLTTIKYDVEELSDLCAKTVSDLIDGKKIKSEEMLIKPSLILRGSV